MGIFSFLEPENFWFLVGISHEEELAVSEIMILLSIIMVLLIFYYRNESSINGWAFVFSQFFLKQ